MSEENESVPWLTVLFQGFVEPSDLCQNIATAPIEGDLIGSYQQSYGVWGVWRAQLLRNRIWVTATAYHPPPIQAPNGGQIQHTFTLGYTFRIATLLLQAQALRSNTKLRLTTYTLTTQYHQDIMRPSNVLFVEDKNGDFNPVTSDVIVKAANDFITPTLVYPELRRALQDYDFALEFNDENRLIYLWRAAEEILYSHDLKATMEKPPALKLAAENLGLYYPSKPDKTLWLKELGKVAHRYARHAGQVGNVRPGFIDAAQARVVEIISRHAQFRGGNKIAWSPPQADLLTDWLQS